jgi:hypothetical protein
MGFAEVIAVISGFFKFFSEVKWFIQKLEGTPQEQREALLKAMQKEADNFKKTGRPEWD